MSTAGVLVAPLACSLCLVGDLRLDQLHGAYVGLLGALDRMLQVRSHAVTLSLSLPLSLSLSLSLFFLSSLCVSLNLSALFLFLSRLSPPVRVCM
jgi:hypothetical protein